MNHSAVLKRSFVENYINEITVALGSTIISFSAVFVRIVNTAPTVTGVYRMLFGGIIIMLYSIATRRKITPPRSLLMLMMLSGFWIGFDISFWHQSIHNIGPGLATVLGNCQVFLLTLIGIVLYKEKVRNRFYLSIPTAAIGLFCLVGHKWGDLSHTYKVGVAQGLATAFFYGLYTTTLRKSTLHPEKLDPTTNLGWISLFSALSLSIVALFQHESFVIPDWRNFDYLFSYAFFCQVIGWALISRGISKVNLSTAGFLILLQPSLSFVWDILFFHRPTPTIEIIGALITFISIYISVTSQVKQTDT